MALKWLGLWTLVLCLSTVVNAEIPQNCADPGLQNGFSFAEQDMAHGTDLYYGCNENFKPVTRSWWGRATCKNGTWTPEPECIVASACFDPQIPNAIYEEFKYKDHDDLLRITCKPGYKYNNQFTGCKNGQWTDSLKCTEMGNVCGPPPELPNAVIVNQDYQDVFPHDTTVTYMCKSGFVMETLSNMTVCRNRNWIEPYPSCRQEEANPAPVPPVSPTASPANSGSNDNHQPLITTTDQCGPAPKVKNGVSYIESDTTVRYECISLIWYKLKGNRNVRCFNGEWTPAPTCEDNFCWLDTSRYSRLETIIGFMKSGEEKYVNCPDLYVGSARALCVQNELFLSECCGPIKHYNNNCRYTKITSQ